jgi:hypothetical protein
MANSASYNKRQVEKNKRAKRKEKLKKKEERKNSPKSTFDDMIAYVDKNGVIMSTPPDDTHPEESGPDESEEKDQLENQ